MPKDYKTMSGEKKEEDRGDKVIEPVSSEEAIDPEEFDE